MPRRSRKYEIGLAERLKDGRHAVNYLNAAVEDSDQAFLLALRDVAEAQKGMTRVSADAHVNRENLYRMLSKVGNPRYLNFRSVLRALRLKFHFEEDLASSNPSTQTTTQATIGKKRSIPGPPKIDQLVFPFVLGSYPHNQPSAAGMGTLAVTTNLFTPNAAAIVVGFGSEASPSESEAGEAYSFSFSNRQAYFQTATVSGIINRNILSAGDEKQREEIEPLPIPKYDLQLAAPHDLVYELTH